MKHEVSADQQIEQSNILVRAGKLAACVTLVGALAAASVIYGARRIAGALNQDTLTEAAAIPPNDQFFRPDDIDRLLEASMCDPSKCKPVAVDVAYKARVDKVEKDNSAGMDMDTVKENITDPVVQRINGEYYFIGHDGLAADRGIHKWRWDPTTMRICASDAVQNPVIKKVVLGRDVNNGGFKNDAAWFRSRPMSGDACHQTFLPEALGTENTAVIRKSATATTTSQPMQEIRRLRTDGTQPTTTIQPTTPTTTARNGQQVSGIVTSIPEQATTNSVVHRQPR